MTQTKHQFPRHGLPWSAEEERELYDAFVKGQKIADCVAQHERNDGGIRSRLKLLGLLDEDGRRVTPPPAFTPTPSSQKRETKKDEHAKRRETARIKRQSAFSPELNDRFREALHLMEETDENLFITGKAGTGKSTLLSYFRHTTNKQAVVLAPTGVAALNVNGQTIHRFFNFYVDVTPEKIRKKKGKPRNAKLYKNLKTIIIDEISMVRADLLDCIDAFLRLHGPHPSTSFGGVQMIFVGDLYQLPPVVTSAERDIFTHHYPTPYFFSAHALQQKPLTIVELDKVYRQKDQAFVDLLNKIRNNTLTPLDLALINSRVGVQSKCANDNMSVTLTTTNSVADHINASHLAALKGKPYNATAHIEGDFTKEYFPTAPDLAYKIGAQVMMLNNDSDGRWVNGSIGVIADIDRDEGGGEYIVIKLQDSRAPVEVYPHTWEVFRFTLEEGDIVSDPAGTFTQYPFRLAWAITIHKSQGKTFNRIVLDIGRGAFAAGQMYVALSRCTSFEGLTLTTPLRPHDIRTDCRLFSFLHPRQMVQGVAGGGGGVCSETGGGAAS